MTATTRRRQTALTGRYTPPSLSAAGPAPGATGRMWLFIGAITLLCACVYAGRKRYAARWAGWPYSLRDGTFLATLDGEGSLRPRPRLGLATRSTLEFECKAESWLDRFFKWTGLSVELQLGEDGFDRTIYLIADNPAVIEVLRREPDLCDRLAALFRNGPAQGYRVHRVVCRRGKFWVEFRHTSAWASSHVIFSRAAPEIRRMWAAIPERLPVGHSGADPLFLRSVIVLAFSTGLAIHGGGHLYRLMLFDGAVTLEWGTLLAVGLVAGGLLLALQFGLATALLARSSRLHLIMLELLLVGSFGALSTGVVEVRDLNIALDTSNATPYATEVLKLRTSRSRRGGTRRYAYLAPWGTEDGGRLRVSPADYHALTVGEPATVHVRGGYFGIRWIEGVRPGAPASDAR